MKPIGIVVHCTAGRKTASAEDINQVHIKERGWSMIGYHYLIRRDGNSWVVEAGRPEYAMGAHCKENKRNYTHLGVAVAGNYETEPIEEEAFQLLLDWVTELAAKYEMDVENITYHRREQQSAGVKHPKACPGKYIINRWSELIEEVSLRLPTPGNP